jgi:predicted permease
MRLIRVIADILFATVTAVALWSLYMGDGQLDIRILFLGVVLFYIVLVLGPVWFKKAVHGNRQRQIRRVFDIIVCACIVVADVGIEMAMGVDEDLIARHITYVAILAFFGIYAIRMAMAGRIKRRMAQNVQEATA